MRRKLRVFVSFLLILTILLPLNVYSPPNTVEASVGGAFGDSASTTPGNASEGVVTVRNST